MSNDRQKFSKLLGEFFEEGYNAGYRQTLHTFLDSNLFEEILAMYDKVVEERDDAMQPRKLTESDKKRILEDFLDDN